jgi:tRNA threonylcarbamoyl adenosine modification protein YeaZ
VAVLAPDGRCVERASDTPQRHAECLLGLVESCLDELGVSREQLDRVAVGTGPGSFTGLRVGIALAQGLGLGLGCPVVGVPSLQAMASAALAVQPGRCVVPVVDAHRQELFVAAYNPQGTLLWGPSALPAVEAGTSIAARMGAQSYVLVGSAARALGPNQPVFADAPSARAEWVARLALTLPEANATPLYARGPDATLPDLPPNPLSS